MLKIFSLIKYKVIRLIEGRFPLINILIYNNSKFLTFFLPHEKDYYGMTKLFDKNLNFSIIDIGANNGISSLGFRKLGFKNTIYLFEPNKLICDLYLKKIEKKNSKMIIKNLALDKKKSYKNLFVVYYKGTQIHHMSSFDKKYILNTIKLNDYRFDEKIKIIKTKVRCSDFDSINFKFPPKFIKIDTEGNDYNILLGMKKSIKKFRPVFLIEYNKPTFIKINKYLKSYNSYIYDFENDLLKKIDKSTKNKISRFSHNDYLTNRNIYYIPSEIIVKN